MTRILTAEDQKALILARNIVTLWEEWNDEKAEENDNAMRDTFKEAVAMDLTKVEGVLASPLSYFARAYLYDENPEDLTFSEMTDAIKVSVDMIDEETAR